MMICQEMQAKHKRGGGQRHDFLHCQGDMMIRFSIPLESWIDYFRLKKVKHNSVLKFQNFRLVDRPFARGANSIWELFGMVFQ